MKKIIIISMLAATLAATSAFGQGWIAVDSGNSQVWDGFSTPGVSTRNATAVNIGLFWAAAYTANPMPLAFTPANGNSTTVEGYTPFEAWDDLLGASSWTLAQSTTIGGPVITTGGTRGAVVFSAGSSFDITGTSGGQDIALLEVGWSAAYATPTDAQNHGSSIGWSYLASVNALTGNNLGMADWDPTSPVIANLPNNFGVFAYLVPEPSMIALAGLSGLSLLLFRRRK